MTKHRKTWKGGPKITRAAHISQMRQLVNNIKNQPCQDCGGSFPTPVMEFDHTDSTTKREAVSTMVETGMSQKAILTEIAKCDLVCANCHRLRTWKRKGISFTSEPPLDF